LVAKRKRKPRSRGIIILVALALLIAGFVVRRTLVPRFLHFLAYRPPERAVPPQVIASPQPETASRPQPSEPSAAPAATPAARGTTPAPKEHLTERDRQELEAILKRKSK
jgi:hypothetical protein